MVVPFAQGLETGDLASVRRASKADYHCHCYFGTRIENVERWLGHSLDRPIIPMRGLRGMLDYASKALDPYINSLAGFEFTAEAAVDDAIRIRLHICPSSNVMLGTTANFASHPIRALFDHGVEVTVNTDDLMIFGQSVSQEYMNLFKAKVFSADELDSIRVASIRSLS